MDVNQIKRATRTLSEQEQERLQNNRDRIAAELPDLQARDQMRKDAREEATVSGELRRAVHASDKSIDEISSRVGISPVALDEFLTGERTLRSDILDRLAQAIGYQLRTA